MLPGEIISIILKNSVEYVLFYLATLRIGCIINPYPYNLESKDAIRYLENVNPKLLFCHKGHYEYMKNSAKSQVVLVDDDFLDNIQEKSRIRLFGNAGCAYTCPARICYKSFSKFNKSGKGELKCSQDAKSRPMKGMIDFDLERLREKGFHKFKLLQARVGNGTGY